MYIKSVPGCNLHPRVCVRGLKRASRRPKAGIFPSSRERGLNSSFPRSSAPLPIRRRRSSGQEEKRLMEQVVNNSQTTAATAAAAAATTIWIRARRPSLHPPISSKVSKPPPLPSYTHKGRGLSTALLSLAIRRVLHDMILFRQLCARERKSAAGAIYISRPQQQFLHHQKELLSPDGAAENQRAGTASPAATARLDSYRATGCAQFKTISIDCCCCCVAAAAMWQPQRKLQQQQQQQQHRHNTIMDNVTAMEEMSALSKSLKVWLIIVTVERAFKTEAGVSGLSESGERERG